MKEYFINTSKYSSIEIGSIREQYDTIMILLNVIKILNVQPINEIICNKPNANIIIVVDKMSRLFWGNGDKIHSIQFPFLIKNINGFLISLFQGQAIDSQTIAILDTILNKRSSFIKSIDNMCECFIEIMYDYEIDDKSYENFCWKLLIYLLSFETGYLRYDHDENEERVNAVMHPIDHIDFYYSSNNTFKIGLPNRILLDDFRKILDINSKSFFLKFDKADGRF